MIRHLCLLLAVVAFCYYTDSCNFKARKMAGNVLKLNTGAMVTHQVKGNTAPSGYSWTATIDNPEIISVEAGLPNETLTQMDPSQFNFKIRGKHKGRTRVHFEYKKTGQVNIAPRRIEVIEIEVT